MADLLLELFSEEIPARMQAKAEADLVKTIVDGLKKAGLEGGGAEGMSGPRRLAVSVTGLPARSADVEEEKKGPKVGAPEKAVAGFLRGAGLSDISEAEVRSDPKKGDFYVALKVIPGRETSDIIAELVPEIVRGFHWPKSMRWGTGDLRWVRPLQRILCILDGEIVPFEIDGLASGNETEGHRVHGRGPFRVKSVDEYKSTLEGTGHVLLTREARRDIIADQAAKVCADAGLELVEDKGLLEEVTGLAEWPSVILGDMDPAFLELPPEVIQLSMRTHQKYFAVRGPDGKLAPHFVVIANVAASDGGKAIAAGNAKVLSARLEDGRFFYANDKAKPLEEMAEKLSTIAFKEELGSIGDKVERVAALARELAPKVGADADMAERAAKLAKADLVSEMVYEFPELQGVMGRYYAIEAGENAKIADAIRDHYKPQGPSDEVPSEPVAIAVALADKLDTLVGFWAIDDLPTGSKDPFALRRAALGVVRIILENSLRLPLENFFETASRSAHAYILEDLLNIDSAEELVALGRTNSRAALEVVVDRAENIVSWYDLESRLNEDIEDLLSFFADRLKQYLRDEGERHDLIDAVFALGEDDLVLITRRVEALGTFLDTDDGANLLAGYKRAANILKAETKKGWSDEGVSVDAALIKKGPKVEQALHAALTSAEAALEKALPKEDFTAAMTALAGLRAPVDAFFDGVMVNDEDEKIRANRLALLTNIRATIHKVADFSKVEG